MKSTLGFEPLYDRIVVRRLDAAERSRGGILIPETAKEKPQEAEVLAVGTGRLSERGEMTPLVLKVGDRVVFSKWGGIELKLGEQTLLVLREDEIIGRVTGTCDAAG